MHLKYALYFDSLSVVDSDAFYGLFSGKSIDQVDAHHCGNNSHVAEQLPQDAE